MPELENVDHLPAGDAQAGPTDPASNPSPTREVPDDARDQWALAAREVLTEVAGTYHSVLTYKEVAAAVQERTGIHTRQLQQHWIGDVLARVAAECLRRDEPNLSSLCVNAQGSVGESYRKVVTELTGSAPEDPDAHAAQVRLECYRAHGADLPDDGGRAALTPKLGASRSRLRAAALRDRPVPVCPKCHMAVLPSGACDTCD